MKNTYFTSDTHFGHQNIIKYCSRPWATAAEMDEAMIKAWNEKIAPGDDVYHLGDVAFMRSHGNSMAIIERLNGNIKLVAGNHDNLNSLKNCKNIEIVSYGYMGIKINNQYIELCHFPIEEWNHMHHGSWHLCGHVHNRNRHNYRTIQKLKNRLDVGVDNNSGYVPFSFEEVQEIFKNEGN